MFNWLLNIYVKFFKFFSSQNTPEQTEGSPEKEKTLRNVTVSMHRLGRLMEQEGAKVYVAKIPGHDSGKIGIDDWVARGNTLEKLHYSTLDEWVIESPWIDHETEPRND